MYSDNALAIILLCSHLNIQDKILKPYSAVQWNTLAERIVSSHLNEPADLIGLTIEEIQNALQIDSEEAIRIDKLLSRGASVALQIDRLEQNGIKIVTRGDKEYPTRVKKRLGKNAPPLFYYAGDLALLNLKSIAIVGSRNISEEGQKIANDVAKKFTENKLAIVSGGAKGVDSISEQAALESGGVVVSFVADSLEKKIKNKEVRNDILARRKLLITSQNPELGFSAGYAMNRNKYIYSVSSSAFVISSDFNKGGTWNGAIENIKNKWVPTYVYNSTLSEGNSALIAKGAIAFDNIDNIDISALSTITYQPVKQLDLFNSPKVSDSLARTKY